MTAEQGLGEDDGDGNKGDDGYLLLAFLFLRPCVCAINCLYSIFTTAPRSGHCHCYFADGRLKPGGMNKPKGTSW